ncbi:laccase domain-containing protein [Paenarthrobacter nitroguajacolicus]|uniref:Laccase domain-containing protein n=1 Tax=Paenarthrobacter nitroguajacolicus TaxID=211146 RepID=A0A558GQB2_PAENT|nr:polyphenol oxidase family protein [Paenarthrobacter nitroguajacolicus]TVU59074.1 laccase domain-containing protein [Paenarthrobacter nitroguajacolicus]
MFWWRNEVRPGVSVAFTDAGAGNLALHVGDNPEQVSARRTRLAHAAGLGARQFQYMNQVHGNTVEFIAAIGPGPTADAMVSAATDSPGAAQPLAVMVADCVPVVFAGVDANNDPIIAVAHAGRPGVASAIVGATVAGMRSRGAVDISAWLGPSICGSCYEVPEQLRTDVAAKVPATWSTTSWGTPALDLPAGVRAQLAALDVPVAYAGECTLENDSLFSYRRESRTGRFAGLVWTHD